MPDGKKLAIDAIKVLAMDAVQAARSGHPGTPMALAPLAYVLWTRHLRHNPANPAWPGRDRFVLSAGHASMLLYALLHLSGYELSLNEIRRFRQWDSMTPGHPELGHAPGVETTTGPLGQGVANSVGMALAERWLAARWNRPGHEIVDHRTFALCSDGDLMEGLSHEAAELAGHQKLGKLIWLFDDNRITIEGATSLATSTDQARRFESYGWQTLLVEDGADTAEIDAALQAAKADAERPSLISIRTTIADGSPNMAGLASTHGAPLGEDEVAATKRHLGYPSLEPFHVPEGARDHWRKAMEGSRERNAEWAERFANYRREFPELADALAASLSGGLPDGWDDALPALENVAAATRGHSGKALQAVAGWVPFLVGGSADLGGSNKTDIAGGGDLLAERPGGRVVHFGVREHAMGAIMNGMALHGGVRPFGGTFLVFSDYMRPAIRLAALMRLPVVYVFSHDSIGLGEDGPTHQPVEHLAALRAIPGLLDLRPADGAETVEAWRAAMRHGQGGGSPPPGSASIFGATQVAWSSVRETLARPGGPAFLSLSRQGVPVIERSGHVGAQRPGAQAANAAGLAADEGGRGAGDLGTGAQVAEPTGPTEDGALGGGESGDMKLGAQAGESAGPIEGGARSLGPAAPADGLHRGGYVLRDAPGGGPPDAVVIASGSEVALALEAQERLAHGGIRARVVSLPSWFLFSKQDAEYRAAVVPPDAAKVSVEAGSTMGWERWIGTDGVAVGIDRFGASAPFEELYRQYGLTAEAVADAVRRAMEQRRAAVAAGPGTAPARHATGQPTAAAPVQAPGG